LDIPVLYITQQRQFFAETVLLISVTRPTSHGLACIENKVRHFTCKFSSYSM